MNKTKTKLTSVNICDNNRKNFKKLAIDENITFQKLVNISLELYLHDVKFRKLINKNK